MFLFVCIGCVAPSAQPKPSFSVELQLQPCLRQCFNGDCLHADLLAAVVYVNNHTSVFTFCSVVPADKPFTEQHGYSAVPPASPASMRRQQQLQHMRQQRQQHNQEREDRCLAGDAAGGSSGKARGTKAQNAQQQARLKHNQGVKASSNVGVSE